MNISQISGISHDDEATKLDLKNSEDISLFAPDTLNPFYSKQSAPPLGSIMMTRTTELYHFEVPPNERTLLYDDAVNELNSFTKGVDMS